MSRHDVPVQFFGKLKCRGDFVRSTTASGLIHSLDRWMSSGIELMSEDVHWKQMYDQAKGVHFLMLNAIKGHAVVGHLLPSADSSGRRFPFIMACGMEVPAQAQSVALSPLLFQSSWTKLHEDMRSAVSASEDDAYTCLQNLQSATAPGAGDAVLLGREYEAFIGQTSLASFSQTLNIDGGMEQVRQLLLALGLLLQPLVDARPQEVDKGIVLPLPKTIWARPLFAAWWMDLIALFVGNKGLDLTVILPATMDDEGGLRVCFSAGAPAVLQALMDTRHSPEVFIPIDDTDWVRSYLDNDYGLKKFSSYLQQPSMSLVQVRRTFQEAFLGA
jgi:type VI secretion system protein ImpM